MARVPASVPSHELSLRTPTFGQCSSADSLGVDLRYVTFQFSAQVETLPRMRVQKTDLPKVKAQKLKNRFGFLVISSPEATLMPVNSVEQHHRLSIPVTLLLRCSPTPHCEHDVMQESQYGRFFGVRNIPGVRHIGRQLLVPTSLPPDCVHARVLSYVYNARVRYVGTRLRVLHDLLW